MSIFDFVAKGFRMEANGYPRLNSIVRIVPNSHWYEYLNAEQRKTSFFKEGRYLYLGEIVNMPGHGVFVGMKTNVVYTGYHIDEFEEITEEEV